jgi:putative hydrolase of the HAD superfamily
MTASDCQFEVVLFDVGGVMLTNGWDHNERAAVLDQFGIVGDARARLEAGHNAPYDALERDLITMDEFLQAAIFAEPRSFTPAEFLEAMKAQSKVIPDNALSVLAEISSTQDVLVGVLNNESRLLHEYRMETFGIGQYLDVQFASPYVALRKPEPAIYKRAIDILACPAERIIFIDDRKGNADAAAASGMHAIQFLGEEKLRHDLQQIGIL